MTVLTINFTSYLMLDLRSMTTAYLQNVPTTMAWLLSIIFLTPKVIMSVAVLHSSYIIANLSMSSHDFGTALIKDCIYFLINHSTIQVHLLIIYCNIDNLLTIFIPSNKISSKFIQKFVSWSQAITIVQTLIVVLLLVSSRFGMFFNN